MTDEALSKRKDLMWTEMTQFSLSARVSSNPEKKRTIANVIGSEEGCYCMCGNGEKDAGHNIHRVFSRCYMQLDYTPNEYNAMQPAMLYDPQEQEISRYL